MGVYKYQKGFEVARIKPSKNLRYLNVLYVEDEESIREPFKLMIERYFKTLFIGTNGEEGLEIYKQNKDKIDIIISDIKMPKMTGLEMATQIKEINSEIPIIFTTAFGDREYLKEAIDIGAEGYIIKPIDRNKLFNRLNFIADGIQAKRELIQYTKLIEVLFNYQKDALVLFDKNLEIKIYNSAFKELINQDDEVSLVGLLKHCDLNDIEIKDLLDYLKLNNKKTITCSQKGELRYFDVDLEEVNNYFILNLSDVTKYKIETEIVKETAMVDELTNLYNRKKLNLIKEELLNTNLCLIIFDIDNFKKINDTYGHLKGDEVLQKLADKVKHNLRESDLVIRWGGEEFLIILKNLSDENIAVNLAEKLRQKINEIYIDEVGNFSCSFGVSCGFVTDEKDINKILDKADEALYKAKRGGKNRVETQ